ncbi:MAG: hypothetical protein FIA99_05475 [Ruminiclostridium sp.]|nr:hypothetical protein [Ruminiclostridium sp.]
MADPFKVYVNRAAFVSTDNEMQILLFIERPSIKPDGQIAMIIEELGTVALSHEYASKFGDAFKQNMKDYQENKSKKEIAAADEVR